MRSDRMWGDGGGDQRPHVIVEVIMTGPPDLQFAECGPCNLLVYTGSYLSLDRAWAAHRELEYHAPKYGDLATDSEVAEFLRQVEDPTFEPVPSPGGWAVTRDELDIDRAHELVVRLKVMRLHCTCHQGSDITLCPNYMEGDDD